jgi:hypothetical protein
MGIGGLLPLLRSISEDMHVQRYANQKVAIDRFCPQRLAHARLKLT